MCCKILVFSYINQLILPTYFCISTNVHAFIGCLSASHLLFTLQYAYLVYIVDVKGSGWQKHELVINGSLNWFEFSDSAYSWFPQRIHFLWNTWWTANKQNCFLLVMVVLHGAWGYRNRNTNDNHLQMKQKDVCIPYSRLCLHFNLKEYHVITNISNHYSIYSL